MARGVWIGGSHDDNVAMLCEERKDFMAWPRMTASDERQALLPRPESM